MPKPATKTVTLAQAQKAIDKHPTMADAAASLGVSKYALKKLGVKGRPGRRPSK